MEGRRWVGIGTLTAGDGVREVTRTVLLGANVADTARIKREHRRLGERGEGGRGGAAESLSLSQKKGRRRIGTCSRRRNFSILIPLPY